MAVERKIGEEILQGVRELKRGEHGRAVTLAIQEDVFAFCLRAFVRFFRWARSSF